jgi:ribose transport system ATP-binding protein/rhamnose transport system ATP-binding protein
MKVAVDLAQLSHDRIEVVGVTKQFPGVKSLDAVSFGVRSGEIHALVGENGAGKSTLMKVMAGAYTPDEGEIRFEGKPVQWKSAADAKARGIHVIYQELVLFPQSTVAENIYAGAEPRTSLGTIDHRRMNRQAQTLLNELGVQLDPRDRLRSLSVADQQMVEIAKAMAGETRVLVLDEPTAVIAGKEVQLLFERLRVLRARGVAIIYISHRLEEIFALCDRVTVMKDGRKIATQDVSAATRDGLVRMMVGREMIRPNRHSRLTRRYCSQSIACKSKTACSMRRSPYAQARLSALPAWLARDAPNWRQEFLAPCVLCAARSTCAAPGGHA